MPSNTEKTGYTFIGWHTDVECTEAYSFPSTMPANNVTLYAKWEINNYALSFNSNGGNEIDPLNKAFGSDNKRLRPCFGIYRLSRRAYGIHKRQG